MASAAVFEQHPSIKPIHQSAVFERRGPPTTKPLPSSAGSSRPLEGHRAGPKEAQATSSSSSSLPEHAHHTADPRVPPSSTQKQLEAPASEEIVAGGDVLSPPSKLSTKRPSVLSATPRRKCRSALKLALAEICLAGMPFDKTRGEVFALLDQLGPDLLFTDLDTGRPGKQQHKQHKQIGSAESQSPAAVRSRALILLHDDPTSKLAFR